MTKEQTIKQIQKILENFHKKVDLARAEYRKKINDILKRIDDRRIERMREKLNKLK